MPEPRTAVVTGAGGPGGIGRVTARMLAENGWHVALIDINAAGLPGVEKELQDAGHSGLLSVPTTSRPNPRWPTPMSRSTRASSGRRLVNLAGIPCTARLHECSLQEFQRVMAVNVTGSYLMLKAAAPRMIPRGVGRIGQYVLDHRVRRRRRILQGVYAAAEAAVIGICKGGARELGPVWDHRQRHRPRTG